MRTPSFRAASAVLIDVALLAVSIVHIPTMMDRPWIPFRAGLEDGRLVVKESSAPAEVAPGDVIVAWNGIPLKGDHDMEFLSDFRRIGDPISLTVERAGMPRAASITLVPAYSLRYLVITTIVGVITWCVAVFVILARPRQHTAGVLHWSLICMGMVTMLMLGRVEAGWFWPYLTRSLFFLTYAGVAAFYLHFTYLFPIPHPGLNAKRVALIYMPPVVVTLLLIAFNARAIREASLADYSLYCSIYDIFHVLLVVYVFWGLGNFVLAYRKTREPEERKKLKWLLWGLSIGPAPFMVLITIPELFMTTSPIPEEFCLLPLVAIPVSFAISFVRYHVLDVEIVIQRTTVYAIVLAVLALVYAGIVWLASSMLGVHGVETTAIAAVGVGLAFEPARRRVQHTVDRLFFQVRYDFRRTARRFVEDIGHAFDPSRLAEQMLGRIEEVIPVSHIAFLWLPDPGGDAVILSEKGFEAPPVALFGPGRLPRLPDLPMGVRDMVEGGVRIDTSEAEQLLAFDAALAFAMKSRDGIPLGLLILGKKRSGARFAAEDVDLLSNVSAQAGLALERVMLHGALIRKQTEAERLKALNEMKSEFVSNVSHELRTPLTSIKIFTEMLKSAAGSRRSKGREYLEIIQEEAGRLDRLVSTVLDAALIERGAKTYAMSRMDLAEAVRDAYATMEYQLRANGFSSSLSGCSPRVRCLIDGDRDAVVQAIINLMGNAIKYSVSRRVVRVSLARKGSVCRVSVADRGQGIPAESREKLFQRFFRDPDAQTRIQGFGIGLAVVKHIMDAHEGSIEVKSVPANGSTFTLVFPVLRAENSPARQQRRKRGAR